MNKKQPIGAAIMLALSIIFILSSQTKNTKYKTLEIYDVFDTYSELTLLGKNTEKALTECNAYLHDADTRWSAKNPESEISALNSAAGVSEVALSDDTLDMLEKSVQYSVYTNGFFDITVGSLVNLWDISKAQIPSNESITTAIHKTGFNLLEINKENKTAMLSCTGAAVDLGAVAKGYATAELLNILKKNGISSALINLGGNTYALGNRSDGTPWKIGIQDPGDTSRTIGDLSVYDTSVITSGNYQRYFEKDGVRYHHIINPYTGNPSNSGLLSVTVINRDPFIADILSTACFVIGYKESLPLLRESDSKAIFVTEDNTVYYSADLQNNFDYDNSAYEYKSFK